MADTGQGVSWFLQYACPFRRGDALDTWAGAYRATRALQAVDDCVERGDCTGTCA